MFLRLLRKFTSEEKVRACLYDLLAKHSKVSYAKLSDQSRFKEIGMNSLDIIELLVDIEESLQVDLLDDEVVNTETCEEAIKVFSKHLNNKFCV